MTFTIARSARLPALSLLAAALLAAPALADGMPKRGKAASMLAGVDVTRAFLEAVVCRPSAITSLITMRGTL